MKPSEQTSNIIEVDLQGLAVTLTELGEYTRAVSMLEDLTKVSLKNSCT